MISIIAAHSDNLVIGNNNSLPWHIPEDLQRFKRLTTGHAIIMGKNTWLSIGRSLPNRRNIVVSRTLEPTEGVEICDSLDKATALASDDTEIFIIGGAQIYESALKAGIVDRMYITHVETAIDGDAFFPQYAAADWEVVEKVPGKSGEYTYHFITYERPNA